MDAFYRLMATDPANLPKADKLTIAVLSDLFLEHSKKHNSPGSYESYRYYLQSFCDTHGRSLAASIKPLHVNRWLDAHPTWKASRRHAVISVKRLFSWADQQGVFTPSPVRTMKPDGLNRRTRVLSAEEQAEIAAAIKDYQFRQFVRAMFATGCRPSEVARVTAADIDLDLGVWVFQQHKTVKKTKKPRVVYLTPEMIELSRQLMVKNPEGPIFRGPLGNKPFSKNAIRIRFLRLRKKLPHLKHFSAYAARHSFATNALVNGVGIAHVAELLGHTSTVMVSNTYSHLSEKVGHMREAALKAAS
jgi:integrase